MAVKPWIGALK